MSLANSHDIEKRSSEIIDFIIRGDLSGSISRLLDFANDFDKSTNLRREAVLIKYQYMQIDDQQRKNQMKFGEILEHKTRLADEIMKVMDILKTNDNFNIS